MNTKIITFLLTLLGVMVAAAHTSKKNNDETLKTVVIDPGHGGKDNGCSGFASNEKTVTLAIALRLGAKIKAHFPNVKVIYTRQKDEFVELHQRSKIANQHGADLFISIHCNAAVTGKSRAIGSETYVLGLHRAEENLEVLKRENDAMLLEANYKENYDLDPNAPENHILNSFFQYEYLNQSIQFAEKIERELVLAKRKSRGVKQAGFAVLRGAAMPAVLVESDFLTHPEAGRFLESDKGKETIANAIFKAFKAYKNEVDNTEGLGFADLEISSKTEEFTEKSGEKMVYEHLVSTDEKPVFEFKIQIAAASLSEKTNFAAAIAKNKSLEIIEEGNMAKLLATGYASYEAAQQARKEWVRKGYTGAFVTVYKDGKRTTVEDFYRHN